MNRFVWGKEMDEFIESKNNKTINNLIKKQFEIKLQATTKERTIIAIASTGTKDRAGDTLNMGNWIVTGFLTNPVFLYAHNINEQKVPIGTIVSLRVVNNEMWIEIYFPKIEELTSYFGQPELIHDHAKFVDLVYNAYRIKLLRGISVGFTGKWTPADQEHPWDGRDFTEQTLVEISAAPVPCNPEALAKIGNIPDNIKQYIAGGGRMETKTGQRLSKQSKEMLKSIKQEIYDAHDEYTKAHKKYNTVMKGCGEKLAAFVDQEENDGDNEGQEEDKSFESLLDIINIKFEKESK